MSKQSDEEEVNRNRIHTIKISSGILSGNDITFDAANEGPMLQSMRLLRTAYKRIHQQLPLNDDAKSIIMCPLVHYFAIYVFVDIDYLREKNGQLRNEFKESCKLLLKNKNFVYGLSSQTLTSTTIDDWSCFTSVHFHTGADENEKATIINKIIDDDIPGSFSTIILFGGPYLNNIFQSRRGAYVYEFIREETNDDLNDQKPSADDLPTDTQSISSTFNLQETNDDWNDQKPSADDLPTDTQSMSSTFNLQRAWLLHDYSIFEYILYYVSIHQSIKSKSKYLSV